MLRVLELLRLLLLLLLLLPPPPSPQLILLVLVLAKKRGPAVGHSQPGLTTFRRQDCTLCSG